MADETPLGNRTKMEFPKTSTLKLELKKSAAGGNYVLIGLDNGPINALTLILWSHCKQKDAN